jgi:spore maturation protein CgeB
VAKWDRIVGAGLVEQFAGPAVQKQLLDRTRPMEQILEEVSSGSPLGSAIDLEAALVWRATREYRLRLVQSLLPLGMVVYGDSGWRRLLPKGSAMKGSIDYYRQLPSLYARTAVNFNATSLQMNSAVNQRVFDCAACGAFLLSDRMADMDRFFEPGTESVCYGNEEEAVSLAAYYLKHDGERNRIAAAARRRVLAEHTYEARMASLVRTMAEKYA